MLTVNMHEAKSRLSELVRKAEAGEVVILARGGKPVARLVTVAPMPERRLGLLQEYLSQQPDGWDEKMPVEEAFPGLFD